MKAGFTDEQIIALIKDTSSGPLLFLTSTFAQRACVRRLHPVGLRYFDVLDNVGVTLSQIE